MGTSGKLIRPDKDTLLRLIATMNNGQIAELYNCSRNAVGQWRKFYGMPRSIATTAKWNTDRNYFSKIDTPKKAYILGFIIADGHVAEKGVVDISIKESDSDLLYQISDEVGCNAPMKEATNSYDGSKRARLTFHGKTLVRDLNALGVFNDKSKSATYPCIPRDLDSHLIRGLWDGDGYVGKNQFDLIGTPAILEGVANAIERETGCILRRSMRGKDRAYHYLHGTRRDTIALHWIYKESCITLRRKQEAFLAYWSQIPRT